MQRWFRPKGTRFQARDEVREHVHLEVGNLVDESTWPWPALREQMDLVLVRYVTRDLAPLSARRVAENLGVWTAGEGVIIPGPLEGLTSLEENLGLERWGPLVCYRRKPGKFKINPGHTTRRALRGRTGTAALANIEQSPILPRDMWNHLQSAVTAMDENRLPDVWTALEAALDHQEDENALPAETLGLAARAYLLKRPL